MAPELFGVFDTINILFDDTYPNLMDRENSFNEAIESYKAPL
jgi:hypothetical protein